MGIFLGQPPVLIVGSMHLYLLVVNPEFIRVFLSDELNGADLVAIPEEHSVDRRELLSLH